MLGATLYKKSFVVVTESLLSSCSLALLSCSSTRQTCAGVFLRRIPQIMALAHNSNAFAEKFGKEGLTFDDVLIIPAASSVLPRDVSTQTHFTRTITLH